MTHSFPTRRSSELPIPQVRAVGIAGSANNQLAEARHGATLARRGVLYAPDYAINAGGIINVAHEATRTGRPYDRQVAFAHVARIHDTLATIFEIADAEKIPTSAAADRLAEQRLTAAALAGPQAKTMNDRMAMTLPTRPTT